MPADFFACRARRSACEREPRPGLAEPVAFLEGIRRKLDAARPADALALLKELDLKFGGSPLSTEALLNVTAGSGSAVATLVVEKR